MKLEFTALTNTELKLAGQFILSIANLREAAEAGVGEHDAARRPSAQQSEPVTLHPEAEATEAQAEDKPKRTRRTKAEMEAARAAESETVAERLTQADDAVEVDVETDAPVAETNVAGEQPTEEQVLEALKGFTARHGMGDARALLKSFGAERRSELKPEHFAAFVEAASK